MDTSQPVDDAGTRRLGLGLAALGRPAYINQGGADALPAERTVEAMRRNCHDVLDAAYAAGVRWVDTARSYGLAEEFLAEWLADRGHRDLAVSSKWGYTYVGEWRVDAEVHEVKEHSAQRFDEQSRESRDLLGDALGVYQVHSLTPDSPLFDDRALLGRLAELAGGGTRVGFSTSGPRQAETIERAVELEVDGERLFTTVQSTWNLLEPSAGPALAAASEAGLRVLVKEPLANGRLVVDAPDLIRVGAERAGVGPDAVALAAALAQPWADTVLLGPASVEQLRENLLAVGVPLLPAERYAMAATLAEPPERYWQRRSSLPWR
ncbi:aldo/keto reductase [Actinoalloteichus spitiensis]|uniref:aldo/keto reductase n=1 Tax=Actinoalloteichus spitiensis TaxID=252394 RepID=UPI000692499D|nr:aldo/keto reductase [Actinoalloteichus spitiensis]